MPIIVTPTGVVSNPQAGMGLVDMRTELQARGYARLPDSRLNQYLNDAYTELCEAYEWSWLEATASGTAPLSVADVREVLAVVDTTVDAALEPLDLRDLAEQDGAVSTTFTPTTTGTPSSYWLDGTTLRIYPVSTTDTIAVRYIAVPPLLVNDTDLPYVPARYRSSIVDIAEALASVRDESDPADQQVLRQEVAAAVQRMISVGADRLLTAHPVQVVYDTEQA